MCNFCPHCGFRLPYGRRRYYHVPAYQQQQVHQIIQVVGPLQGADVKPQLVTLEADPNDGRIAWMRPVPSIGPVPSDWSHQAQGSYPGVFVFGCGQPHGFEPRFH